MRATSYFLEENADQIGAALAAHEQLLDQFRIAKRIEGFEHFWGPQNDCHGVCAFYELMIDGIGVAIKVYVLELENGDLVAVPDNLSLAGGAYEVDREFKARGTILCGSPRNPCAFPTSGGQHVRYARKISDADGWTIETNARQRDGQRAEPDTDKTGWREELIFEMTIGRPQRKQKAKEGKAPKIEGWRQEAEGKKEAKEGWSWAEEAD